MSYNAFEFANEVCTSLMGNVKTLSVNNTSLQIWTDSTADLTSAWMTGGDPNSAVAKAIAQVKNGTMTIQDFLNNYLDKKDLDQFSVSDTQELLQLLTKNWPSGDNNDGSALMGEIQTFGQLVSAEQQKETSVGDTESKAMGSFIQQLTSAQQPIADMGNSAVGILGAAVGLLSQSFI